MKMKEITIFKQGNFGDKGYPYDVDMGLTGKIPHKLMVASLTHLSYEDFRAFLKKKGIIKKDQWKRLDPSDIQLRLDKQLYAFTFGKDLIIESILGIRDNKIIVKLKEVSQ